MTQNKLAIIFFVLVVAFALAGCAQMFTAKTTASYIVHPDGTKEVHYSSDKEQVGLEASFDDVKVKVDKAGTLESVVAASAAQNAAIAKLLEQLLPLMQQRAAMGAGS